MKNNVNNHGVLFLFLIGLSIIDWQFALSQIEYWGTIIFVTLAAILFQLEDMEDKL